MALGPTPAGCVFGPDIEDRKILPLFAVVPLAKRNVVARRIEMILSKRVDDDVTLSHMREDFKVTQGHGSLLVEVEDLAWRYVITLYIFIPQL